ncbi:MAG: hypothetical protein EBR52_05625 [Microbacteriaceae bacterium]|nr:hypothetical protein [Microbacteriaceae bacterium]
MRFIAAIVVFAISATFLVVGVSFKILSGARALITTVDLSHVQSPFLVVDGSVLKANPGLQTIELLGGSASFVSYGRTSDVLGWLGDATYTTVNYDAETNEMTVGKTVTPVPPAGTETAPKPTPAPNPSGSDLWLDERAGKSTASLSVNVTQDMSVLLAANGVDPVPPTLTISWPLPQPTFLWLNDDNLIFLGGGLAVIGLLLYLWALSHWRNQQGPRRRGRMPKPPRPRRYSPQDAPSIVAPARGRRGAPRGRSYFSAIGLSTIFALSLTACSSPYETGVGVDTPTPTVTAAVESELPPVVTAAQLRRIIADISDTVAKADAASDRELLKTRMSGGALSTRLANYSMRANDSSIPALAPIGNLPLTFVMPQAADTWPRSVMVVSQDPEKTDAPTTGMVLVQESARDNYKVEYLITLEPDAYVPETAPAEVGSPVIAPDTKLLLLAPQDLAVAYGDVLLNGDASKYFPLFDLDKDTLVTQVGHDYKSKKAASIADKADVTFTETKGTGKDVALATLNSGAVVAVTLDEIEQVSPLQNGAVVVPEGQQKALLGTNATTGVKSTYTLQMVFYVPAIGSTQKIRLLGFTQGLTAASVG